MFGKNRRFPARTVPLLLGLKHPVLLFLDPFKDVHLRPSLGVHRREHLVGAILLAHGTVQSVIEHLFELFLCLHRVTIGVLEPPNIP